MSGSLTISMSGVPARLRSTSEASRSCSQLSRVFFHVNAQDPHLVDLSARRQRLIELGNLVTLG